MMNKQQAFDKAALGLKSQGFRRSRLSEGGQWCAYNGLEGRHRAFGWLIVGVELPATMWPGEREVDSNAAPAHDLLTAVPAVRERFSIGVAPGDFADLNAVDHFVSQLQRCHDYARTAYDKKDNPRDMLRRLREFARGEGLSAEVLADVDEDSLPEVVQ